MEIPSSALQQTATLFAANFREHKELGASLSVWWRGQEVLSLGDGWRNRGQVVRWTPDTLVPVYSATKGPAAATLLVALHERGLGPDTPVCEVWPRFPLREANFGDLLSHRCGLAALDRVASVWDHDAVVAALEAQAPQWQPGAGHGYHPRTFGTLVEHPVRLLTGKPLGTVWREAIADPLEIDFWIGLPETQFHRVATLYPSRLGEAARKNLFYRAYHTHGSLTRRAFLSPRGLHSIGEMNDPRTWQAGFAGIGGVGSASGLAKFYQAASGHGHGVLPENVCQWLSTRRVDGPDRVLLLPTAFACGCQLDPMGPDGRKLRELYGPSPQAFGHPGAGGSHAFADPRRGLSFAYVMNQMDMSVLPGERALALVRALSVQSP